jgi:uncharacterized membrane protein
VGRQLAAPTGQAQEVQLNAISKLSEHRLLATRWTIREVLQGKPLGHPSHAMFVHFPSALFPIAVLFDAVSVMDPGGIWARAAFYNIAGGLALGVLAAMTGLIDYLPMVGGSRKKRLGTYHLASQALMVVLMAASLAFRATDLERDSTSLHALVLAAIGVTALIVGNWFGGHLVYRQGMRVNTG